MAEAAVCPWFLLGENWGMSIRLLSLFSLCMALSVTAAYVPSQLWPWVAILWAISVLVWGLGLLRRGIRRPVV